MALATDLSRRAAEEAIQRGEVTVNGKVVTAMGTSAFPSVDRITYQGMMLRMPSRRIIIAFNKPRNTMVTANDPQERDTIWKYLAKWQGRINPIGRLDFQTEGLLLLTNDGQLHNTLTHPRHHIEKFYQVKVEGVASEAQLEQLRKGMTIEGEDMGGLEVTRLKDGPRHSWLTTSLMEGKYRQIRRMCATVGLPVLKLKRVRLGPISLKGLERGDWRELTNEEILALDEAVTL